MISVMTLSFQCLAFGRWIDSDIRWSALPETNSQRHALERRRSSARGRRIRACAADGD
jgi:hypothetical protein